MNSPTFVHPRNINSVSPEFVRVLLWPIAVALVLVPGIGWSASQTPPAPPEVAPVISLVYPSDTDGDCIDDILLQRAETGRRRGVLAVDEAMIDVELIFSTPVTPDTCRPIAVRTADCVPGSLRSPGHCGLRGPEE